MEYENIMGIKKNLLAINHYQNGTVWFTQCYSIQPSAPLCFNKFDCSSSYTVAPIKPRVWEGCAKASFSSTLCSLIKKNVSSSNYYQSIYWGVFPSVSGISALSLRFPFQRNIDIGNKTDANYADFFWSGALWNVEKGMSHQSSDAF